MKALEISEEQKKKLLEMCEKLFSECKFSFGINNYYGDKNSQYLWSEKEEDIHWFEFCMTALSEKIFFSLPIKRNSMDNYLKFCKEANIHWSDGKIAPLYALHPIDYLYQEFKKL